MHYAWLASQLHSQTSTHQVCGEQLGPVRWGACLRCDVQQPLLNLLLPLLIDCTRPSFKLPNHSDTQGPTACDQHTYLQQP